jgi:putative FmdB family regulatory protein
MPLYEYECDACSGRFEVIQKFSETTTECRRCGKGPVRRLMAAPAFQFKGTGWYVTDYAQKGKSGAEGGTTAKDTPGDKTAAAKSDSGGGDSAKKTESTPATPAATTSKD